MKFLLAPALFLSAFAAGQTVTVKPTPASDALIHAAQDLGTETTAMDTLKKQTDSTVDSSQKAIFDDLKKANEELVTELKADKKYKDKWDNIQKLQGQLQDAAKTIYAKAGQEAAPIQNAIGKDRALIEGLIPIVRKENDLPEGTTFDSATQKWTSPKVAEKPVEKPAEPKK